MIEFVSLIGRVSENSDIIQFKINGGESSFCIGDQVWCNETELELFGYMDEDVFKEFLSNCEPNSRKAFKGAMRRMGFYFD